MGRHTERDRGREHRLTLEDRGDEHLHRWWATCACGWRGIPGKRKWATTQYRNHRRLIARKLLHGIGNEVRRQPLTPIADLPEVLR